MDHGIKWSKPNKNVETCGLNDLIIHSKYPILKIAQEGSGYIELVKNPFTGYDELVATHNLGYKPIVRFSSEWYNIDNDSKETTYREAPTLDILLGGAVFNIIRPYVTTTQLRVTVGVWGGSVGNLTLNYFYKIYYDVDEGV
jgi:hypothetical protein